MNAINEINDSTVIYSARFLHMKKKHKRWNINVDIYKSKRICVQKKHMISLTRMLYRIWCTKCNLPAVSTAHNGNHNISHRNRPHTGISFVTTSLKPYALVACHYNYRLVDVAPLKSHRRDWRKLLWLNWLDNVQSNGRSILSKWNSLVSGAHSDCFFYRISRQSLWRIVKCWRR